MKGNSDYSRLISFAFSYAIYFSGVYLWGAFANGMWNAFDWGLPGSILSGMAIGIPLLFFGVVGFRDTLK